MTPQHLPTRVLAGITVPDTPLIRASIAYARKYLPDHGYNHIMRSWLVGCAIINRLPAQISSSIDLEVHAVAAILHDLGWSESTAVTSTDKRFEVDGANSARDFIRMECSEAGDKWDEHRIQLVWDAIALHTTPSIAAHKQPEVALCGAGISTELLGPEVGRKMVDEAVPMPSKEEYDAIVAEFPNHGLRGYLKETLCGLCVRKPETTYDNFVGEYGERFVEGYELEGKKWVDLLESVVAE